MRQKILALFLITCICFSMLFFSNATAATFEGWEVEDGGGQYSETDGIINLSSGVGSGDWLILYKEINPDADFEFSLQVNATVLSGFAIMLRGSLPFAGSTDGINFQFGSIDGGSFTLARYVNGWTWNVFETGAQEDIWYKMVLKVSKNPYTITTQVFDQNDKMLDSYSATDMTNFSFEDIKYLGFGVLESGGDYLITDLNLKIPPSPPPVIEPVLVGYWKFDEGTGLTAYDSSNYNNNGALINNPEWIEGKFGKALEFDGIESYVRVQDSENLRLEQFTLCAWIFMEERPYAHSMYNHVAVINKMEWLSGYSYPTGPVFGYKFDFEYPNSADDDLVITVGDGTVQRFPVKHNSINDLTLNSWHFITGTFDGTLFKIYIDGKLIATSDPVTYSIDNNDTPLAIGTEVRASGPGNFKGKIDEVRVYNGALSIEEIGDIYSIQTLLSPADLDISCKSSTVYTGFKIEIEGKLGANNTGFSDEPISLFSSVNAGTSWQELTMFNTDSNGDFSAVWYPSVSGNYLIKAIWSGNDVFSETESIVSLAVVPYAEQNVFSVSSNSTISNLAFNSTSSELSFNVKGETGTKGYTDVYIATTLIDDITKLKVYLDQNELDYSTQLIEDSWKIHLTYNHSTHSILLSLSSDNNPNLIDDNLIIITAVAGIIVVLAIVGIILKRKKK